MISPKIKELDWNLSFLANSPSSLTDVDQPINTSKDTLHVPNGPMTRSKTKALNALVLKVSTKSELKGPLEY